MLWHSRCFAGVMCFLHSAVLSQVPGCVQVLRLKTAGTSRDDSLRADCDEEKVRVAVDVTAPQYTCQVLTDVICAHSCRAGGLLKGQATIRGSTGWCIAYFSFRNSQQRLV